jgi:hypothetical protein
MHESVQLSKSSEYDPPRPEKTPILPQSLIPSQQEGKEYFLNLDYQKIIKLGYGEIKGNATNTSILKIEFYDKKPYIIKIFFEKGKFKKLRTFIDAVKIKIAISQQEE